MNYFLITSVTLGAIAITCIVSTVVMFTVISKQQTNLQLLCFFSHRWINVTAVQINNTNNGVLVRENTQVAQRCLNCNHMRSIKISHIVLNLNHLNAANKHMEAPLIPLNKVNPNPPPPKKKNILTLVPSPKPEVKNE